jgi:hypothetical protein
MTDVMVWQFESSEPHQQIISFSALVRSIFRLNGSLARKMHGIELRLATM